MLSFTQTGQLTSAAMTAQECGSPVKVTLVVSVCFVLVFLWSWSQSSTGEIIYNFNKCPDC